MTVPVLLHVDIDAFLASVEQVLNPQLVGKPVIVGAGVIASCSYEGRRRGLKNAMRIRDALRICPDAIVLEGRARIYRCFAERIFDICRDYAPAVETYLDEAICDFSGTALLYGDPMKPALAIRRRAREETGLAVTIGIGTNRMVAKMASKAAKPDGLTRVLPGDEDEFIRALPIQDLPGVGPRTAELFSRMNIHTIGELRALSEDALRVLLGKNGIFLYERCRGRDTPIVCEREVPKSISRETSFHQDTIDPAEIQGMLSYLCGRATKTLRDLGLLARTVGVKVRYSDGQSEAVSRSLPEPSATDREFQKAAGVLLRKAHARRASLHRVGIQISGIFASASDQPGLFDPEERRRWRRLDRCLDTVRDRFGYSSIVAGGAIEFLGQLRHDSHGYILRTPSLTR
ncbi:MAG: DNA polymerase IV [Planctomycetota bacterium]|nr:DNA polymerase IV [Planctomycetota bacterium]